MEQVARPIAGAALACQLVRGEETRES